MKRAISVEQFVREELPQFLAGRSELQALFASYNRISSYRSGPVETGKPGLSILVQSSDLGGGYSISTMMALSLAVFGGPFDPEAREMGRIGDQAFREEGRAAQANMEAGLGDQFKAFRDREVLVVLYAGLSAFHEAVKFGWRLRSELPKTTFYVVTCTCDLDEKLHSLADRLVGGEIARIIYTFGCGGQEAMSDILKGLIAAWPSGTDQPAA